MVQSRRDIGPNPVRHGV